MNSESKHILVLDDEPVFQKVVQRWLSDAGFQVTLAKTSIDALGLAQDQLFDLVISDYYLPDYLGTDFLKHLRGLHGYKHVPAIMVTARADELDKPRLRRKLQVLVFPKPCNMQRLCDTVRECLSIACRS